jgi:hypothetical protein
METAACQIDFHEAFLRWPGEVSPWRIEYIIVPIETKRGQRLAHAWKRNIYIYKSETIAKLPYTLGSPFIHNQYSEPKTKLLYIFHICIYALSSRCRNCPFMCFLSRYLSHMYICISLCSTFSFFIILYIYTYVYLVI